MSVGANLGASQENIPTVDAHEQRLRQLLAKATQIKPDTSIKPPLQKSDFEADVLSINNGFPYTPQNEGESTPEPPSYLQQSLEAAGRNIFYTLIKTLDISAPTFIAVWNLLDILQFCADLRQVSYGITVRLLEELIDSQTIDGCRYICDYMESRRDGFFVVPKGMLFYPSEHQGKDRNKPPTIISAFENKQKFIKSMHPVLLRACNELLRRLSRAEDAVFCGRIFIFLFQTYPLGDRSGINLRGGYHTDNVTTFDDVAERNAMADESMSEDDAADDEVKEERKEAEAGDTAMEDNKPSEAPREQAEESPQGPSQDKLDVQEKQEVGTDIDDFYTQFWSLQHIFSNPPKLFVQEEFDSFKRGLAMTLERFKATTKIVQTHGSPRTPSDGARGTKRKRDEKAAPAFASNFNPKYLTSRDLFELELSDLTFQRHVLVQALILMDFLLSLTPKAKKKAAELKQQKAMVYEYTLSEEDTKWAQDTRSAIGSYLQSEGDGKYYYRMADTVLMRDKNWVRWKVEECPPISIPPVPTADQLSAIANAKKAYASRRIKANPMGAIDLSFVSDTKNVNSLDTLKMPEERSIEGPERYVRDVEQIHLDLEMAGPEEESYLKESKTTATWRTLRVAARTRFQRLAVVDESTGLEKLKDDTVAEEQTKMEEGVPEIEAKTEEAEANALETVNVPRGPEVTVEPPAEEVEEEYDPVGLELDSDQIQADLKEAEEMAEQVEEAVAEDMQVDGEDNEDARMHDDSEAALYQDESLEMPRADEGTAAATQVHETEGEKEDIENVAR